MDRRAFLQTLAATAILPTHIFAARPRTAVLISMLPADVGYVDRFRIARDAGFDAVEMQTIANADEAAAIGEASKKASLRIHSVMNADHWRFPLSSADPDVVNRSVAGMETSLRNAKAWGADAVLLVPAVVDQSTSYRDAWTRSQRVIRERLLPMAKQLGVVIAVEEVWNKFLLSPLEFARYVDELDSPWLKAYFDVGNVVFYGYPQDWIRALGPRIAKVHLKDFQLDRPNGRFAWKNLGEGDIDWPAVRRAFADVGYEGYFTTEISAGDAAYLKDVANRVDRFLAGEKPYVMSSADESKPNTLTPKEQADGWRLLFDGKTTSGWRGFRQTQIPAGWQVVDEALTRVAPASDIVTIDEFGDFEITLDWRIPPNGNTGVFYRVTEDDDVMWHTAPEFQIIDNAYNKEPLKPAQLAGANYDLQPPSRDVAKPIGSWNQTRVLVCGAHVEHWLNSVKVVEYELWTNEWERLVRDSKFKDYPRYARARRGRIGLQDHGDRVAFRNIKIRELN
jgi:L-ribulose-5-phosphate 3-epimerase